MRDMLTLWDLIKNVVSPKPKAPARPRSARSRPPARPQSTRSSPGVSPPSGADASMEAQYARIARDMVQKYNIRVRRWRKAMTGIAWEVRYRDGTTARLIEAPRPKGPMSAAVFLHEVGHHAIGFNVYKPRCLEEFHAWQFSLREMERNGLNITDSVRRRVRRSMQYAVAKAKRRGIRELPVELHEYVQRSK